MKRFYARLLGLYPKQHRDQFGDQMMRTLDDSYRDAADGDGHVPIGFWIGVLWDMAESLVRERASALVIAALVIFGIAIVFVPPAIPAAAWPLMLVPTVVACGFFIAAPKTTNGGAKAVTVLVAVAVIGAQIPAGAAINDVADLLMPALAIICILFSVKAVQGWVSSEPSVSLWSPTELAFGLALGAVGATTLALSASTRTDYDSLVNAVIFEVAPLACGVGAFLIGRQQRDVSGALAASIASFVVAVTIWIAARPVIVAAVPSSNIHGWRHALAAVLLINAVFSVACGVLGHLAREGRQEPAARGE